LHPSGADPNDPLAAFTEYAADRVWVASHFMQLVGVISMMFALVFLSRMMSGGAGSSWAHVGVVGAGATLSVAATLQAVDGVALKIMVDNWAAASGEEKAMLFQAAFGVRQIEIGLASILNLVLGITATIYGVALASDHRFPRWLGWLAIAGGLSAVVASVLLAYTGFSGVAMTTTLAAGSLLLARIIIVAVWMWRLASSTAPQRGL
jgi:hypothetical protein